MAYRVKPAALARLVRFAAERAGMPTGLWFTERQLYYELCRVTLPTPRLPRRPAFTLPPPISYGTFKRALDHTGEVPGLLIGAAGRTGQLGLHTHAPDVFDYGLPRMLVCESDSVACMLRANGIPMESSCLVLGAGELPLDRRITGMLDIAEQATVFVLHDASPEGLSFPVTVTERAGVPRGVRVVSLGLRPDQASRMHAFHRRSGASPRFATGTTQASPWRTHVVDIESVRPVGLLRTVHRLIRDARPSLTLRTELRRARDAGFLTWPMA